LNGVDYLLAKQRRVTMKSDKEISRILFNSSCSGLDLFEATPREIHKLGYLNGWNDKDIIIQTILEELKKLPTCELKDGGIVAERDSGIWIYWGLIQEIIKKIEGR
jgi:hypothetical protein